MRSRNFGILELGSDVEGFVFSTFYPQFSENSLGPVGRSEPTEFGI